MHPQPYASADYPRSLFGFPCSTFKGCVYLLPLRPHLSVKNCRANETLTLSRASEFHFAPGSHPHVTHSRTPACVRDARVRALTIKFMLLDSVWPGERRSDPCARAHGSGRGLHLAAGTLFGWFSPTPRGISGGRLPWVPRPACAFGARSPKGGYRSSSVTGRDQLPKIDGQPAAARCMSRSVVRMAVPLLVMGFVNFKAAASLATRSCRYNDFSGG